MSGSSLTRIYCKSCVILRYILCQPVIVLLHYDPAGACEQSSRAAYIEPIMVVHPFPIHPGKARAQRPKQAKHSSKEACLSVCGWKLGDPWYGKVRQSNGLLGHVANQPRLSLL